jgi:hypothetical protein
MQAVKDAGDNHKAVIYMTTWQRGAMPPPCIGCLSPLINPGSCAALSPFDDGARKERFLLDARIFCRDAVLPKSSPPIVVFGAVVHYDLFVLGDIFPCRIRAASLAELSRSSACQ